MSDTEDRSALAAEYALGVLEGDERAQALALLDTDPDFARMVDDWSRQLAPLSRLAPATPPPTDLWDRIEASVAAMDASPRQAVSDPTSSARAPSGQTGTGQRTSGPSASGEAGAPSGIAAAVRSANDNAVPLRRVRFWQATTGLSLAIAASLALFLVVRQPAPAHMAVLAPVQGGQAILVATLDAVGGLTIRPNGAIAVPTDRDLELWSLPKGATRPTSLGVLPAAGRHLTAKLSPDTQLLVSLEPRGGSPTGLPTGPVLYGGTLTVVN